MIVAHLSDLHLGFRAYGRVERGVDVRERDVAVAFERAVQEILRIAPDVVVIAGDVFDRPEPPAGAIVSIARALEAFRSSLASTPVFMVAGPRDTPRRPGDSGALAVLDAFPNVEAATGLPRSIVIEELDLHAALIPYRATTRESPPPPEPDPRTRWNLVAVHGCLATGSGDGISIDPADWDYVALGGEHSRRAAGNGVEYPGSLERVGLDPWAEAGDEKGFLTADLERGRVEFHPIRGRPVVALAPIRMEPGNPERLRRRVAEVVREVPGGIADKIVRLRLDGVEPADLMALQGPQLVDLRSRALHLTVDAGGARRGPSEAWTSEPAPAMLREVLEAELKRDGVEGGAALDLLDAVVGAREAESPEVELGAVDSVDGEIPGAGRVSAPLTPGLTAVIGGGGRARRAVADLLIRAGADDRADAALSALWSGRGAETLDGAVNQAARVLAELRGSGSVQRLMERVHAMGGGPRPSPEPARRRGAVRVDPEQVAAEKRSAERDLRAVRADAAEVAGDLQAAEMDWHRERQDAETTLNAYRDRASELKVRLRQMESTGPDAPCPTCGRVLAAHYEEVLTELRDEWEAVVQDGRWWKKRWEQLESKPVHIKELERRSLRLAAAVEAGSERVELLRARLADLEESGPRMAGDGPMDEVVRTVWEALVRVRDARVTVARQAVLARASRYLGRLSGGRLLAITWDGDAAHIQGVAGPVEPLAEEDLAAARLALRIAAATFAATAGRLRSLIVEEPFDRLDQEARVRVLTLLRDTLDCLPRIVLVSRGDAVEASPEIFDTILEVSDDTSVGPALRRTAAGAGRIRLGPLGPGSKILQPFGAESRRIR